MNYINDEIDYDVLYVIGDTHGVNLQIAPMLLGNDKDLKKCILHVGDFGVGFSTPNGDKDKLTKLNTRLAKYNIDLYAIRGNHDDPAYFNLDVYNTDQYTNVHLVPDHTILDLIVQGNPKKVYMNGGAVSVDRVNRTPSKSYWWNEAVTPLTNEQLDEIPTGIDIVITHTRPRGIFPIDKNNIGYWLQKDMALDRDLEIEIDHITDICNAITAKNAVYKHFYGHFHMSNQEQVLGVDYRLLDIDEIIEVRC